jgi:hypothetical protein
MVKALSNGVTLTTTNNHSSHADSFNYRNGLKLANRYSDHATVATGGPDVVGL